MRRNTGYVVLFSLALSGVAAAAPSATPEWQSGFETGFPGEFLDYDDGAYSATGTANAGQNQIWTIVDDSDPVVMWGSHAYRGWPIASQAEVHRCYPVLHADPGYGPYVVNSFMTYVDLDYSALAAEEWVHLATWGNNPDWQVITVSIRDRRLEMAHLTWAYIGPEPQPDFPLRSWVRMTSYLEFNGAETYVRVWQNGVPIFEGSYTDVAGTRLMRAHWGWYSSGSVAQGVEYNDEIQIWTLDAPLTDLDAEPASPFGTPGGTGGTGGTGGAGGSGGSGTGGTTSGGTTSGGTTSGGTDSGGTDSGGTGGSGASTATGGSSGAGTATGGDSSGSGGDAPTSSGDTGEAESDAGCGCRVQPSAGMSGGWIGLALAGLSLFRRRRRS